MSRPEVQHDVAAERYVLGSMLLSANAVRQVLSEFTFADFYDPKHELIGNACAELAGRNEPVSTISVVDLLGRQNAIERAGGLWYLHSLTDEVTTASNVGFYVDIVQDKAVRRRLHEVGVRLAQMGGSTEGDSQTLVDTALAEVQTIATATNLERHQTKSLEEILKGVDTYDWVIPGLLERMDRLVVTGPEGAGKTTWCRQLVVLAAAGIHPVTFRDMPPARVLVIDAENTERQWRRGVRFMANEAARMAAYRPGVRDPAPHVEVMAGRRLNITAGGDLAAIHRLVDEHKPDILYIGPLYKLVPGAITNDDDATPLIVALDSLRERGLVLIMEAHAGKATDPGGQRNLAPRGSSALLGWPEFGLGLRPSIDFEGTVDLVRWRGDRDGRDFPLSMARNVDPWPWTPIEWTQS